MTYLLSADVTPAEIIVVSDGHHNEFSELCKELGVTHLVNEGVRQHHGRITGLKHVKTEFVHMLDDDDYLNPDFYKNLEKYLRKNMVGLCLPAVCSYGKGMHTFNTRTPMYVCNVSCHIYTTKHILRTLKSSHVDTYTNNENFLYFYRNLIENHPTPVYLPGCKVIRGNSGHKNWPSDFPNVLVDEWNRSMNKPFKFTGEYFIDKYVSFKLDQYHNLFKGTISCKKQYCTA